MKRHFLPPRWIFVICALMLAISVALALQSARRNRDLSRQAPAQVFARIFQTPLPAGVSDLEIAGQFDLSGAFWMRFRTHDLDATLRALQSNAKVPLSGPMPNPSDLVSRATIARSREAQAVGWSRAFEIANPEFREFSTVPAGTGWWGVLVVDRAHKIVYARGELL